MTNFLHGPYSNEAATPVVGVVQSPAALPFVVGTAPVHTVAGASSIGTLVKLNSWADVEETFGWVKDFERYSLMEFLYVWFRIYGLAPVLAVNMFDPDNVAGENANDEVTLVNGVATIEVAGAYVQSVNEDIAGETTYVEGDDYTLTYNESGYPVIRRTTSGSTIPLPTSAIYVVYKTIDAVKAGVSSNNIIDGLEEIEKAVSEFGDIPNIICCPGFSQDPDVAAAMVGKTTYNDIWHAFAFTDIDTGADVGADVSSEVANWKSVNSYTDENQDVMWPLLADGDNNLYNMSTLMAASFAKTAAAKTATENGNVPYQSGSNINLPAGFRPVLADGTNVNITIPIANDNLNANGVTTVIRVPGSGWKFWGNKTGAYPGSTDPKDAERSCRFMLNWMQNTIQATLFQKIDRPGNRRQIESVVNTCQIWLNGLAAQGALIGQPKVEFRIEDNPLTDLVAGKYHIRISVTPPVAMEAIVITWQIDVAQFATLFGTGA